MKVAGSCGSGTTSASQPCSANSPSGPGGRLAELRLGVAGEELPRRARAPLLAHEEHRGERAGEHQRRPDGEQAGGEGRGDPVADGAVADLVVVLQVAEEPVRPAGVAGRPAGRGAGRGSSTTCRRGRTRRSAPWPARRAGGRSRRSSPAARRSAAACSAWWKSSLHCACRPCRRPRAAVTSRGSFRSHSAIRVSGRPTRGAKLVDLRGQLLEQVDGARRRPARARRRAAARRRDSRAATSARCR